MRTTSSNTAPAIHTEAVSGLAASESLLKANIGKGDKFRRTVPKIHLAILRPYLPRGDGFQIQNAPHKRLLFASERSNDGGSIDVPPDHLVYGGIQIKRILEGAYFWITSEGRAVYLCHITR